MVELYNAVVNPPDLTAQMTPTLQRVAGSGNYGVMPKASASEDFSFYQQEAPGLFFNLPPTPAMRWIFPMRSMCRAMIAMSARGNSPRS